MEEGEKRLNDTMSWGTRRLPARTKPPTPTLVTKDWWGQEEELQSLVQGLPGRTGPEAGQEDTGNLGGTSRKKSPAPRHLSEDPHQQITALKAFPISSGANLLPYNQRKKQRQRMGRV